MKTNAWHASSVKTENPPLLFSVLICRFLSSYFTSPSPLMRARVCVCVRACVRVCVCTWVCVSTCVCVWEREREKKTDRQTDRQTEERERKTLTDRQKRERNERFLCKRSGLSWDGAPQIILLYYYDTIPLCGKFRSPYVGKAQQSQKSSAAHFCHCVQYFRVCSQ